MDIRTVRTRTMLRDALQALLDSKSFEDISVSEICELSTVRRATFYRHFHDKNDFYEWYFRTITDQFLSELSEGKATAAGKSNNQESLGNLEEYTRYMHGKLIEFSQRNHAWFGRNMGKTALAGSLDMMTQQVAAGIAERIESKARESGIELDTTPEMISMFYSGGMIHTLRWWLMEDQPISAEELERNCTAFLMRYLEPR